MRIGNCRKQTGFTYLTILFVIAVMGLVLANTGVDWSQAAQRDKEQELLFVGNQYRQAIALYYLRTPGADKRYPAKLEDLLNDTRYNPPQHYLRKLYRDPILNQKEWGIAVAPDRGIMGIYSLSDTVPIKQTGFSYLDAGFEGVARHSDWRFVYISSQ